MDAIPSMTPANPRELKFTCVFAEYLEEDLHVETLENCEWEGSGSRPVLFDLYRGRLV